MSGTSKWSGVSLKKSSGWAATGALGLFSLGGTAHAAPPAVVFLLDNQEAMQDFQKYLPEDFTPGYSPTPSNPAPGDLGGDGPGGLFLNTGCTDPALVQAMSFYDKSSSDPAKNGSIAYDNDTSLNSKFFDAGRFYHSRGRRLAWLVAESPHSLLPDFQTLASETSSLASCYQVVDWMEAYFYSPVMEQCQRCLDTQGWWRGPLVSAKTADGLRGPTRQPGEPPLPPEAMRKWVVRGGVLNLRPPKFVIARKALKDVIASATDVRVGVATFGKDRGWYDPPTVLSRPLPDCGKATADTSDIQALKTAVNATQFRHNERPIGEALFGLGGYFSSQTIDQKWENWFKQPLNPGSFGWPGCCDGGTTDNPDTGQEGFFFGAALDEWLKQDAVFGGEYRPGQPWEPADYDKRLMCSADQATSVVVVAGGRPFNDNTVPITQMMRILIANGARHPDGSLLTFDPSNPETNPNSGGVNYCHLFGASKTDCDYTDYNWPTGLAQGNKNFMDDTAFFLSHTDLRSDLAGAQKLRTSVISLGVNSPMLRSIALAGEGQFFQVQQDSALRDALRTTLHTSRAPLP
jgi:hypothetical protein